MQYVFFPSVLQISIDKRVGNKTSAVQNLLQKYTHRFELNIKCTINPHANTKQDWITIIRRKKKNEKIELKRCYSNGKSNSSNKSQRCREFVWLFFFLSAFFFLPFSISHFIHTYISLPCIQSIVNEVTSIATTVSPSSSIAALVNVCRHTYRVYALVREMVTSTIINWHAHTTAQNSWRLYHLKHVLRLMIFNKFPLNSI